MLVEKLPFAVFLYQLHMVTGNKFLYILRPNFTLDRTGVRERINTGDVDSIRPPAPKHTFPTATSVTR